MISDTESCAVCFYYVGIECRRYAPHPIIRPGPGPYPNSVWPCVPSTGWCGDFFSLADALTPISLRIWFLRLMGVCRGR